jgi:hypothetical protein
MSLINDALKRAQESQPKNPSPTLPPIPEPETESSGPNWMLIGLIILLIVNALIFINLAVSHKKAKAQNEVGDINRAPVVETPASAPAQKIEAAVVPVSVMPMTNAETNLTAIVPAGVSRLKVQGIVFTKRPWAIVNGKTVSVGDRVRDLRVMQISQYTVTFEADDGAITKLNVGE